MKTIVLIKQVPMAWAMELDPETRTLKRDGVRTEVSSFDVRALLAALELRSQVGGEAGNEVVALTMGPPQARAALEHCLALGADRGIHLTDRAFAGSDTLATARALALAVEREGADLVLCGRHSTDAETGQVGPEVAELLGWPQVTAAAALELDSEARRLTVTRETDDGFETLRCPLPALISATEDLVKERFPRKDDKERAKSMPVAEWSAADLSDDLSIFGAEGSPTWVTEIETVDVEREQRTFEGDLASQVDQLVEALVERGLFGSWDDDGSGSGEMALTEPDREAPAVWVVAEILGGAPRPVTLELLGKAVELGRAYGGEVAALLIGDDVLDHAATLSAHGAGAVVLADDPRLADYDTDLYAAVVAGAIERHGPRAVLFGSTAIGRDLAPRVAARLGLGLTGDCIDLAVDGEGRLVQYKPAFGGNVVAPIFSRTVPQMATVRPGLLAALAPDGDRSPRIERLDLTDLPKPRIELVSRSLHDDSGAAALDNAEIAIGVGKGLGGPEGLELIGELSNVLGGAPLATTRTVADLGWLPRQHQVGLTGRAIAPELYFAIALRGALEHTVGIRRAGIVVAINDRDRSPIFKQSDYGIVGDYREIVPLLIDALRKASSISRD